MNDAGDALLPGRSMASAGSVANSQCTVSWRDFALTPDGNNLQLHLNIALNAAFGPNLVFYLAARDVAEGNNTGWQAKGTWRVR